jgi:flotillin
MYTRLDVGAHPSTVLIPSRYYVSGPNSYLVVTGAGIENVLIKKKAFVYPMQRVTRISITPFDFSMSLQAMTIEKLKFSLPAVFTIGPENNIEALTKYAVLLTGNSDASGKEAGIPKGTQRADHNHVQNIVKGIIEGETRSIVSTMTMEELFRERKIFKQKVIESVQSELTQFGLRIYNANVKELQDTPGSEYFSYLSRKAHEGASNQAKVDVADAHMRGQVGEAEKHGRMKQEIAKINAATAVLETERKGEKATADAALKSKEIEIEKHLNIERIEAQREGEQRDAELQRILEQKRADMELEKQRATKVTAARIERESAEQRADAALYTATRDADAATYRARQDVEATTYRARQDAEAKLYAEQQNAEAHYQATTRRAEADFFRREREAEAEFIAQKKKAEGLEQMARAYGAMADVMGGPQGLLQYLMLERDTYGRLADANARAVHGMQPKINVWNTGAGGEGGGADPAAPIRNLFQSLPPLLSTIQDQTGMQPPSWLAQMPPQGQGDAVAMAGKQKTAKTNGV